MVLKKQTVWLLTMLTLMVVLSAYYLFNHQPADMNDLTVLENEKNWLDVIGKVDSDLTIGSLGTSAQDFFLSYRLERDTVRARLIDEYDKLISSDATAQVIAEAKGKMDQIWEMAEAELTLESLIKAEGFEEAVVIADADRVNVVVRSEDALERTQVLSIINLVKDQLNVAGNQVVVRYK